jgi:hypothetical protein
MIHAIVVQGPDWEPKKVRLQQDNKKPHIFPWDQIRGRAESVYTFLRSDINVTIPRFIKQDLDERYGFAMSSLQNALDSRYKTLSKFYQIVTVSPLRDDDGNLIERIMQNKKYTQLIQLLIGRCAVFHSADVIGTSCRVPWDAVTSTAASH